MPLSMKFKPGQKIKYKSLHTNKFVMGIVANPNDITGLGRTVKAIAEDIEGNIVYAFWNGQTLPSWMNEKDVYYDGIKRNLPDWW